MPQSRRRRRWCELSVVIENRCNRAATRVALAVVVVLMTMMTLEEPPAPLRGTGRATSWRPLRVVGAMCFSLYCWHVQVSNPNSLEISRVGLFLLTTAGITILSYRFIEFPQKTWRALLMLRRNEGWKQRLASYKPANLCLKDHAKHTRSEDDAPKSDLGDHSRFVCRRFGCGCLRAGGAAGLLRN